MGFRGALEPIGESTFPTLDAEGDAKSAFRLAEFGVRPWDAFGVNPSNL